MHTYELLPDPMRHPWRQYIRAISVENTYQKVKLDLEDLNVLEFVTEETFNKLKIPKKKITETILREYKVASWFNETTSVAKILFKDREIREITSLYLMLEIPKEEIASELTDRYPIDVSPDDVDMYRHYFWDTKSLSKRGIERFCKTFTSDNADYARRIIEKEVAEVRHALGLPLNIRDLDMLRHIRDTVYLNILGRLGKGREGSAMTQSIKALTDVMSAAIEVESNTLSAEDEKPLYKCTFEEATALETVEDLIKNKEDIIGGEDRALPGGE